MWYLLNKVRYKNYFIEPNNNESFDGFASISSDCFGPRGFGPNINLLNAPSPFQRYLICQAQLYSLSGRAKYHSEQSL